MWLQNICQDIFIHVFILYLFYVLLWAAVLLPTLILHTCFKCSRANSVTVRSKLKRTNHLPPILQNNEKVEKTSDK